MDMAVCSYIHLLKGIWIALSGVNANKTAISIYDRLFCKSDFSVLFGKQIGVVNECLAF